MLRQEAERNKGNVNSGVAKVIRYGWKTVGGLFKKRGLQEFRRVESLQSSLIYLGGPNYELSPGADAAA
jgi:hypothetical protein